MPVQERLPETEPLPAQEKEPMFSGEREPVRVIGEALELYILAQQGDNLLVIDKHAAHERMIYDRLRRREAEVMSQTCLEPVPYTPDRAAAAALSEELPLINSLGFGLEPFGNGTFVLRSTPCGLEPGEALSALDELRTELGIKVYPIVTVHEVVGYLSQNEVGGRLYIDDAMKRRIEAYLAQYGA